MRGAALSGLIVLGAMASAGAACGGGEGPELVEIRRLDLTGIELSFLDYLHPAFADQYPDVVAEVNGEPITGEALAQEQVALEFAARQETEFWAGFPSLPEEVLRGRVEDIESADPLEAVIDNVLKRQAVERLGLLPSYEEAVEFARQQEESFIHPQGTVSPENREQMLEVLRLQGFPAENWAADPRIVEGYRLGMGLVELRNRFCELEEQEEVEGGGLVGSVGRDCTEFLKGEREEAEIRYFVKWAE